MIKKFDIDKTKEYGEFQMLPRGGYVCVIKGAKVEEREDGSQVIVMAMDIAEGEYKNYYQEDLDRQTGEKQWHCRYWLNVPKDDGSERDEWDKRKFKTFTTSLEKSNEGYKFDWDELKFIGKLIGGLFNYREFETSSGTIGVSPNLAQVRSVDTIRSGDYKLPKDKTLSGFRPMSASSENVDSFATAEIEIPF